MELSTGLRYAKRARLDSIFAAQAGSSFGTAGEQTKILRRDAVFPAPVWPNGPSIVNRSTEGSPVMSSPSIVVRKNGLMRSSRGA